MLKTVNQSMKIGDQIRVQTSVIVYHHPEHRNQPFDIQGLEGQIAEIMTEWEGQTISPNYPFLVTFSKKFRAHLQASEIQVIT